MSWLPHKPAGTDKLVDSDNMIRDNWFALGEILGGTTVAAGITFGSCHHLVPISTSDRDTYIDIVNGKTIYNSTVGKPQVIVEGVWKNYITLQDGEIHGDTLFRGASAWVTLAAGVSDSVLKTKGPDADPVWGKILATNVELGTDFAFAGVLGSEYAVLYGDGGGITNVGASAPTALTINAKVSEAGGISILKAVYVSGATAQLPTVSLADNTDTAKYDVVGVAIETKADNLNILIRSYGEINGLNTNAWEDGDKLYLSTSGDLVNTKPTSGRILHVADVSYKHASLGKIMVHVIPDVGEFAASNETLIIRLGGDTADDRLLIKNYSNVTVASVSATGALKTDSIDEFTPGVGVSVAGIGVSLIALDNMPAEVPSEAQGDIIIRGADKWQRLGYGASGYYLKTQGTGANPIWDAVAGVDRLILSPAGAIRGARGVTDSPEARLTDGEQFSWVGLKFDKDYGEKAFWQRSVLPAFGGVNLSFKIFITAGVTTGVMKYLVKTTSVGDGDLWNQPLGVTAAVTMAAPGIAGAVGVTTVTVAAPWTADEVALIGISRMADDAEDTLAADTEILWVEVRVS